MLARIGALNWLDGIVHRRDPLSGRWSGRAGRKTLFCASSDWRRWQEFPTATDVRRRAGGRLLRGHRADGRQNPMHYPETQKIDEYQSERATSLAGCRPLYPICRRSGTAPESQRIIAALFENCEQSPHFPHSSVIGIARASSLPSFQLPGMSTVAGPLKCLWSALFFGRSLFRWF